MDNFRNFLESSTIHGLSYITSTRKLIRVSWILVIIAGFTGAGLLIYESFQTWAESPVTTTVETLPIDEITFPKVTVCPPVDTYTDLNYDIVMSKNMTLSSSKREELLQFTLQLLHQPYYEEILRNLSTLEEENRYFNWYHGYTQIGLPYNYDAGRDYTYMRNDISTGAAKGSIKSRCFGQKFYPEDLVRTMNTNIKIHVSSTVRRMRQVSLVFELVKIPIKNITVVWDENDNWSKEEYYINGDLVSADSNSLTVNVPLIGRSSYTFMFTRKLSDLDFEKAMNSLDLVPGFNLSWHFNTSVESNPKYAENWFTNSYVR